MKRHILFYLVSFSFLFFSSCLSVRYVVETPEEYDYTGYAAFDVEEHCLNYPIGVNSINQQRIENAIFLHLRDSGLNHRSDGDLLVKYFVKNQVLELVEGCEDYYDRWEGGAYCVERIHTYTEGTLVIDIIDRAKEKVIWHGAAVGPVYDNLKNPNPTIRKVVDEILKDFDNRKSG